MNKGIIKLVSEKPESKVIGFLVPVYTLVGLGTVNALKEIYKDATLKYNADLAGSLVLCLVCFIGLFLTFSFKLFYNLGMEIMTYKTSRENQTVKDASIEPAAINITNKPEMIAGLTNLVIAFAKYCQTLDSKEDSWTTQITSDTFGSRTLKVSLISTKQFGTFLIHATDVVSGKESSYELKWWSIDARKDDPVELERYITLICKNMLNDLYHM